MTLNKIIDYFKENNISFDEEIMRIDLNVFDPETEEEENQINISFWNIDSVYFK